MKTLASLLLLSAVPALAQTPAPTTQSAQTAPQALAADTPRTTVAGNTFIAPAGWSVSVRGPATILAAPEGDSWIALVDVQAKDADSALAAAWAAYKPDAKWPLKVTNDIPDRNGWSKQKGYDYQTSPNEKRTVQAAAKSYGAGWTVTIVDVADAVLGKRGSQVTLVFDRLLPKGYERESFARKAPNKIDATRLAALSQFIEQGQKDLGIPGVALGIVQDGKLVYAGGFGVRELGKPEKVDGDTLFMIASNTKALTTLLLAKEVAAGKLTWDTPVTTLLPSFKLGDPETTKAVRVRQLICACTGMPRQDLEWLLQFQGVTPEMTMQSLGTMQPTSKFGELFQYSNPMASAAGYTAGHVLYPDLELGAAYDKAMQAQVFDPLGMTSTTFDFDRALKSADRSWAHSPNVDGQPSKAVMELNWSVIPQRPAGAAWSSVRDMLRYVQMELDEGMLPDGTRYIAREPLLERRAPQVAIGKAATYGMGLMVDTEYEVPVVHHGGDMIGFHSDMIWIPSAKVGAVILTNADPGWILRTQFRRRLLEVLYDGRLEAAAQVTAAGKTYFDELAAERKLMTIPPDPAESAKLAPAYSNPALGEVAVSRDGAATVFDFGEWKSEMATRKNPDGTVSFLTTRPGMAGFELVVGSGPKKTLITRDAQHEYVFDAK
jgi:CubicO group peptidase (beta-lactamase class C family)